MNAPQPTNTIPLTQMVARFGNLANFKEVFEKRGFIVIDEKFITWYYVAQVMSGEKLLVKSDVLPENFIVPPRFFK